MYLIKKMKTLNDKEKENNNLNSLINNENKLQNNIKEIKLEYNTLMTLLQKEYFEVNDILKNKNENENDSLNTLKKKNIEVFNTTIYTELITLLFKQHNLITVKY